MSSATTDQPAVMKPIVREPETGRSASVLHRRAILSTLWIFLLGTYAYSDITGFMDAALLNQYLAGEANGVRLTEGFLLGGAILMQIPIAMILVSRVLKHRLNRIANITAAALMGAVQLATLFVGSPTLAYMYSSVVIIGGCAYIVWYAWTWRTS